MYVVCSVSAFATLESCFQVVYIATSFLAEWCPRFP